MNDKKIKADAPAENLTVPLPSDDGGERQEIRRRGEGIPQPDGSRIAPNGAVIRDPLSDQPEILPGYEYTPEKEDLNLLIM